MKYDRIALVILDGVGIGKKDEGDMVEKAYMPCFKNMIKEKFHVALAAHGTAVGLASDDDMGNSEVGHNALGSGQIVSQGAKLVKEAIESKSIFENATWKNLVSNVKNNNSNFHFIGLLSDGNVHSNIDHLISLLKEAKVEGVKKCFIHILLDGRDVPSDSALIYVDKLENALKDMNDDNFSARIASGGGRMVITMDRYQADWNMVKLGWDTHVNGIGKKFSSATEAITTYRNEGCESDQYLPPFVIAENDEAIGKIKDGDSVVFFNFRGDRSLEISMAFDDEDFTYFDRGKKPNVMYAGMLEYDGDLKIPKNFLVSPPEIKNTLTEVLCKNNIKEFALSETQKYGHVTYFWNGNRSEKFDEKFEDYLEIDSDKCTFDKRPWMKAGEIADAFIKAVNDKSYGFIRCNFPNGDMVGHTGNLNATRIGLECVDLELARIKEECEKNNVLLLIVADHGNADQMYEYNKEPKQIRTAHSLNPVWFIINEKSEVLGAKNEENKKYGLANVAPTILKLFNIEIPNTWQEPVI